MASLFLSPSVECDIKVIYRVRSFGRVWREFPTDENVWQCQFMIPGVMLNILQLVSNLSLSS